MKIEGSYTQVCDLLKVVGKFRTARETTTHSNLKNRGYSAPTAEQLRLAICENRGEFFTVYNISTEAGFEACARDTCAFTAVDIVQIPASQILPSTPLAAFHAQPLSGLRAA